MTVDKAAIKRSIEREEEKRRQNEHFKEFPCILHGTEGV